MDGLENPENAGDQRCPTESDRSEDYVGERTSREPGVSDSCGRRTGCRQELSVPECSRGFRRTQRTEKMDRGRRRTEGSTPVLPGTWHDAGEASKDDGAEGGAAEISREQSSRRSKKLLLESTAGGLFASAVSGKNSDRYVMARGRLRAENAVRREVEEQHLDPQYAWSGVTPSACYLARKPPSTAVSRSSSCPCSLSEAAGSGSDDTSPDSYSGSPLVSSPSSGDEDMIMAEMVKRASLLTTEFPAPTRAPASRPHFEPASKKFRSISRWGKAQDAQKVKWKARRKTWPRRKEGRPTRTQAGANATDERDPAEASAGSGSALTGVDRLLDMFTNTTTAGVWRLLGERDLGSSAGSALRDLWYSAGKSIPSPAACSTLPPDFFDFFPTDCLQAVFQYLSVTEILRLQIVNTAFYSAIRDGSGAFVFVRTLVLDGHWARLNINERQQMLLQMQRLQVLRVGQPYGL